MKTKKLEIKFTRSESTHCIQKLQVIIRIKKVYFFKNRKTSFFLEDTEKSNVILNQQNLEGSKKIKTSKLTKNTKAVKIYKKLTSKNFSKISIVSQNIPLDEHTVGNFQELLYHSEYTHNFYKPISHRFHFYVTCYSLNSSNI